MAAQVTALDLAIGYDAHAIIEHLNFEVRRSEAPDVVVATGKYVLVAVKRGEFKPTLVPDLVREKLALYVESSLSS